MSYRDLINADGTRNADAFAAILASRIIRDVLEFAMSGPVTEADADKIEAHQRAELEEWTRAMERSR